MGRLSIIGKAAVLILGLDVYSTSASAEATSSAVQRDERVLVVVSDLTTHASAQNFLWLYRFLEAHSVSMAQQKLGDSYREIRALTVEQATLSGFHEGLASLSADPQIKAIDVFLHLHGGPNTLWFHEGARDNTEVESALKSHAGLDTKLRLLYSLACYGTSHAPTFLAGGFQTASGSVRVNTNGAYDYPTTLEHWGAGHDFATAQGAGNNRFYIDFWDGITSTQGFSDVGSYKEVHGAGELTIDRTSR